MSDQLEPDLRRLIAPNPSPMTQRGTNTYLLGTRFLAVIDPGPNLPAHQAAILGALKPSERITHIFVTHSHLDHSSLARPLSEATGAPIYAYGPSSAGRSKAMTNIAHQFQIGGCEGIDPNFVPDRHLVDGETIETAGFSLTAHWTPGHMGNHLCFASYDRLFSGDHVMGWASSLVSPPDGDLTDFMASCEKLTNRPDRIYYPGHGDPIENPAKRLAWLISHRRSREAQIMAHLTQSPSTTANLTKMLYADVNPALWPAAQRNVLAHLIDLLGRDTVKTTSELGPNTIFATNTDNDMAN